EILGLGSTSEPAVFAVQVGAFRDPANAERLKAHIEASYGPVVIQSFDRGDGFFYRVRVGHENSEGAALALAEKLRSANLATQTFVTRLN
ncbi:MAG: SPOR domain-containing protein, partial [Terriglobia bacterium]